MYNSYSNLKRTILCVLVVVSISFATSSTHNVIVTRSFDKDAVLTDEAIGVTVNISNNESQSLNGFYFVENIPTEIELTVESVKVNNEVVTNYIVETDQIYSGKEAIRFIFETPAEFNEGNGISGSNTAEIKYRLTTNTAGQYGLSEFHWVGLINGEAAFGFSESADESFLSWVAADLEIVTEGSLPDVDVGAEYSKQLSADGGSEPYTWTLESGNLPTGLSLDSLSGVISGIPTEAGTYNFTIKLKDDGILIQQDAKEFSIKVNSVTSLSEANNPDRMELLPNYPNPFNPETHIPFVLKNQAYVSLTIYNLLGQQVRALAEGKFVQGLNTVMWDGTDNYGNALPGGIYLAHFKSGSYIFTHKITMIK